MIQLDTFIATFDPDFTEQALAEIMVLQADVAIMMLASGVARVQGVQFSDISRVWIAQPPIFVRHVAPVAIESALSGTQYDVTLLQEELQAHLIGLIDPALSFSVQTRVLAAVGYKPYDFNSALAGAVVDIAAAPLDVRNPQQIVSVTIAERPDYDDALYGFSGVSMAVQNLSNWTGGMRRFAREHGQISRSEFKLLEALELFRIELPPHGVALDLGAAPGGWTRVLRARRQYVTAVDPGDLDPRLGDDSGVRHLRMTAEAYLKSDPDRYDVIVNDMRMGAHDSALQMVAYAVCLQDDGVAIMTIKLPKLDRRSILDDALEILASNYVLIGVRQLFHNRSEVTVALRRVPVRRQDGQLRMLPEGEP